MTRENPSRVSYAAEEARALLDKQPKLSSRAAARILRKKHPEMFASVDVARSVVRRIRGSAGEQNRTRGNVTHKRSAKEAETCRRYGYVPEPEKNPWRVHTLPPGVRRWLIMADLHIPYHDRQAVIAAIDYGKRTKCDGVILLGDVADAYQLSRFMRDPTQRSFCDEVEIVKGFVHGLASDFGAVVVKGGNHEQRLERYLMRVAPELFGIPFLNYEAFWELKQHGISWVPPMDPIVHGKLTLLHGHEWPSGTTTPVNPARTAFLRGIACVVVGHQHKDSQHGGDTLDGRSIRCWSLGCLCDLHPAYRPIGNQWTHGFGVLDVTSDSWRVETHPIVKGEVA